MIQNLWFQPPDKLKQNYTGAFLELMHFKGGCFVSLSSLFDPLSKIVDLQRPSSADGRRVTAVGVAEV